MPYSSIDELPASVKKLSEHAQRVFLSTFNSVYEEDEKESRAFAIAWSQAKKAEIKKSLDDINYYLIGKADIDAATLTNCPPGKHAHSTFGKGRCHDITINHHAQMKMDNQVKPLKGLKHAKPMKGEERVATEGQMSDEFIRKARKEFAQLLTSEKDKEVSQVYYMLAKQANEVIKDDNVENWGVLYKMLEKSTQQFPEIDKLRELFEEIQEVQVDA